MAESILLRTCLDRLQWAQNQGQCWYERLNSGKIIANYTDKHDNEHQRAINLCRQGTADIIVIQRNGFETTSKVTFLETKSKKGRQTKDQREFERDVRKQGCGYILVKNIEQLEVLWS
jgi:hypothetical protein